MVEMACKLIPESFSGDKNTRVCDLYDMDCYLEALKKHRGAYKSNDTYAADFREKCSCLSSCSDIQYAIESINLRYLQRERLIAVQK